MDKLGLRKKSSTKNVTENKINEKIQQSSKSGPLASASSPNLKVMVANAQMAADNNLPKKQVEPQLTPQEIKASIASQKSSVLSILERAEMCTTEVVLSEVTYFYNSLGLADSYFLSMKPDDVSEHIMCLFSAKSFARLSNNSFRINVQNEENDRAVYICNSTASLSKAEQSLPPSYRIERRIELKFLGEGQGWDHHTTAQTEASKPTFETPLDLNVHRKKSLASSLVRGKKEKSAKPAPSPTDLVSTIEKFVPLSDPRYRIQCFRTQNYVSESIQLYLWFFFIERASFLIDKSALSTGVLYEVTNLKQIANDAFMASTTSKTREEFQEIIDEVSRHQAPVLKVICDDEAKSLYRVMVCYREGSARGFFATVTSMIKSHENLLLLRKELEPFHNFTVVTLWVRAVGEDRSWQEQLERQSSLLSAVSASTFANVYQVGTMDAFEIAYTLSAELFAFYFCAEANPQTRADVAALEKQLTGDSGLSKLHTMVRSQELTTWSESRIHDVTMANVEIVKLLFKHFVVSCGPSKNTEQAAKLEEEIKSVIRSLEDDWSQEVLLSCLKFNTHAKRTNMFRTSKSALIFEIDMACLHDRRRYPVAPHAVFLIVGSDFRGFHIRFSDIARGGVRLIKSRSSVEWQRNASELFFENYSLALTQFKKNKDIPEGGSKGVILPAASNTDYSSAFKRYIDSILDMLIPDKTEPTRKQGDDMIFIGPDENTADLMDWASEYANLRGLTIWKAFTTGKSARLGGIPHDKYGMTTRGVHRYVVNSLKEMGLKEEEVTKCQTGGPDGDLGSNEILISKDKTISIVDGSGVIYDPQGLNRIELQRLAVARLTVDKFNVKLLSSNGFLVTIDDKAVTLPDGTHVEDGVRFRNNFHLHPLFTADVFVPCGGRPAAVNMGNINSFLKVKDSVTGAMKSRFKLICEGANLFITQDARLVLEKDGVVLFKDASANKGGVTSSSCEVLAALTLTEEEHSVKMCMDRNKRVPEFYEAYAVQVQQKIEYNADREFECVWKENKRTGQPMCEIGDVLSGRINTLASSIRSSPLLWDDTPLRDCVFRLAVPSLLIDFVGGPAGLVQRVPDSYCRWIFASFLASHYVYTCGLDTTEFTFMTFIEELKDKYLKK